MDNLSRAQNKENEIKIENLKGNLSKLEKHTLDTEKEIKGEVEKFSDLVNYHINNKANPHEVTTEQVTIINDPTPFQDAAYSGDSYPLGISTFHLAGSAVGYPSKYGECLNVKTTKYRFAQFFFNAGNQNDPRIYLRHWYPSTGWTEFITIPSSSDVDDALKSAKAYTDAHANDKNNPHSVTKDQIGLGKVANEEQATKKEFDLHTADLIKHITAEERKKWDETQSQVDDHIKSRTNPHQVTTKQITLINDPAFQDASYEGDNYPDGISTFPLLVNEATGYPNSYGGILNVKSTQYRFAQVFFPAGNLKDPRIYIRHWYHSIGWTDFVMIPTLNDLSPIWTEVPLKNGAKHGDRKVRCATIGGLLLLEGEIVATRGTVFGTLPASYRPSKLRCKIVPIYGTTGVTKLYIETNGNMRLEGQISDKLENITSYGLDEVIPL